MFNPCQAFVMSSAQIVLLLHHHSDLFQYLSCCYELLVQNDVSIVYKCLVLCVLWYKACRSTCFACVGPDATGHHSLAVGAEAALALLSAVFCFDPSRLSAACARRHHHDACPLRVL